MNVRARIIAVLSAAALVGVCAVTACKSDHCSDADGCTLSDDDIASCADIETGIYGVTTSCEGRAACPDSDQGVCDSFGVIAVPPGVMITPGTVYDDAGTVASAHDGRYALSLSPGDYYVCCPSHGQVTSQTCAIAHVETGKKVRIDAKLVATGGGVSCTTTAR